MVAPGGGGAGAIYNITNFIFNRNWMVGIAVKLLDCCHFLIATHGGFGLLVDQLLHMHMDQQCSNALYF